jgi:uncharacterized membrane protein
MAGLWFASIWMVIGAVIVGISDAFSDPGKRSLFYANLEQLIILFCIIVAWPLLLILIIARLAFMLTVDIRKKKEESKPLVNQEWE